MFGLEITLINIKLTCRTGISDDLVITVRTSSSLASQPNAKFWPSQGFRVPGIDRLGLGVSDGSRYFEVVSEAQQTCLPMRNLEDEWQHAERLTRKACGVASVFRYVLPVSASTAMSQRIMMGKATDITPLPDCIHQSISRHTEFPMQQKQHGNITPCGSSGRGYATPQSNQSVTTESMASPVGHLPGPS